jgi:hypothetical protein
MKGDHFFRDVCPPAAEPSDEKERRIAIRRTGQTLRVLLVTVTTPRRHLAALLAHPTLHLQLPRSGLPEHASSGNVALPMRWTAPTALI